MTASGSPRSELSRELWWFRFVCDTRKGKFERPIIYRFDSAQPLRLLRVDGSEYEIAEGELVQSKE